MQHKNGPRVPPNSNICITDQLSLRLVPKAAKEGAGWLNQGEADRADSRQG